MAHAASNAPAAVGPGFVMPSILTATCSVPSAFAIDTNVPLVSGPAPSSMARDIGATVAIEVRCHERAKQESVAVPGNM